MLINSHESEVDGLNTYLVIGGEGFVGHQLVKALHERYGDQCKIYSSSRTQRYFRDYCKFIRCDLTSADSLRDVLEQSGAKTVFLAAASHFDASREVTQAVNVQGMVSCLEACRKAKVRRLVVTSSTVVIFNGKSVENADETTPYAPLREHRTHYAASKSEQEQIAVRANGLAGVYIAICRPNGMIGDGDVQVLPSMLEVLRNGQGWVQVGDNRNLCEFDNVRNITLGHILACEKLLDPSDPSKPGPSAGEIFNITGGKEHAMPLFTFVRWVFKEYNGYEPRFILKIPMTLGWVLAYANVFFCGLIGATATGMTPDAMVYATAARWHNIDKAKRILGYEPVYSVADGLREGLMAYKAQEEKNVVARAARGLDKAQPTSGGRVLLSIIATLAAVLAIVFAIKQRWS